MGQGKHLGDSKFRAIAQDNRPPQREQIWLASLVILPYASYLALLVMLGLFVTALVSRGQQVWRLCGQRGFGWLTAGLLLSASFGLDRGEAFLQLANFLPFFVVFGILATVPSVVTQPFAKLEILARWLLLTALPMILLAMGEYGLKFSAVAARIQALPLPGWLLTRIYEPDFGHRARSVFGHPNVFSAYLVIVLGLGLGLLLKTLASDQQLGQLWIEAGTVTLCVVAIFCTGSRNGMLIALVLLAIALYAARRVRWVLFAGLVGAGAIAAAISGLGLGGRSLSLSMLSQDPRVGVWRLAIEMIKQRPWLGWGFSSLRSLYVPNSIPDYDAISHAHNTWLFLASEAGIPVMVGFCAVIGTLYYDGVKTFITAGLPAENRAILLGYLLAFASCLMFALFDVILFDARINILSWGLLAAIYALSHHSSSLAPPNLTPISSPTQIGRE
ncbi:MAG: O-antigen ligase family protein [Phormidesmis sp.]